MICQQNTRIVFDDISLFFQKVEGDCDVALTKVQGTFTVTGFRCKSSPGTVCNNNNHNNNNVSTIGIIFSVYYDVRKS